MNLRVFTLCALLAMRLTAAPVIVNGTAATVGEQLITVQDAYFYRALSRLREGNEDPFVLESREALRKTVQKMVFDEMVFSEMKGMQFVGGPRSQAVEELSRLKAKGKDKFLKDVLKRFARMESEAIDWLYKSLQVDKFLAKKIETLTPIITRKEVEQYFNQNQERFSGSTIESMRPSIENLLKKERTRKALEEWIRFLRDKYGVSNNLS